MTTSAFSTIGAPLESGQSLKIYFADPNTNKWRDIVAGAWVAPATAIFGNCGVALTEAGTSGVYELANLPAGMLTTSEYKIIIYTAAATGFADEDQQVFAAPLLPNNESDPAAPPVIGLSGPVTLYASAVVARAQTILQDTGGLQWTSEALTELLGLAVSRVLVARPGYRLQNDGVTVISADFSVGDTGVLPLPLRWARPLAYELAAEALDENTERADQQRAQTYHAIFESALANK